MTEKKITIAIDGPSGAGKSTMAKKIAEHFSIRYIDTGAIYRSVGLYAHSAGADLNEESQIKPLLDKIQLEIEFDEKGRQRMLLDGEDVSEKIRLPEVSIYASQVSVMGCVREFLLDMQRSFALENSVVMDGRDIGTVVLPDADIKIFLTADTSDRAKRRYEELVEKGIDTSYKQVLDDLIKRDDADTSRENSPLRPADDAVIVDTSENTLEQTTERLVELIEGRIHSGQIL